MERNVLLKSLGWGILVAEVLSSPDDPDLNSEQILGILKDLGLHGVLEIWPDPSNTPFAVIVSHGQEPCRIERDLMGPDEVDLLMRISTAHPSQELRQRMDLLGLTTRFPSHETVSGRASASGE